MASKTIDTIFQKERENVDGNESIQCQLMSAMNTNSRTHNKQHRIVGGRDGGRVKNEECEG